MPLAPPTPAERLRAALPTAAVVALIGYALVAGLAWTNPAPSDPAIATFDVTPPPPDRVPVVPKKVAVHRPRGAAAPPNLRSQATPIVAPPPIILPPPVPVVAAPVAGRGADPSAGAAERPGPGSGAGGIGNGTGSGGSGDGDGYGDDETPPRLIRGRLKDSDYPDQAAEAGSGGTVSVRYYVEVDGRVTGCRITHSSGSALLDATTCRLIEKRFRYDPSRDLDGRPVRSIVVVDHDWIVEREPADR